MVRSLDERDRRDLGECRRGSESVAEAQARSAACGRSEITSRQERQECRVRNASVPGRPRHHSSEGICDGRQDSTPLPRNCRCCIYAVTPRRGGAGLLVCMNAPGAAGELSIVKESDACECFRRRRLKPVRTVVTQPADEKIRYIPLTRGRFTIVDAADYEWLGAHKWFASLRKHTFYACRNGGRTLLLMHRVIMEPPKGMVVDHINGNGLDNRRSNLRVCTNAQNVRNSRPKGSTSRFKGVYHREDMRKWCARIYHAGRQVHLGNFEDERQAARAYDRKALELFGEYAYLNFPAEIGMPHAAGGDEHDSRFQAASPEWSS